MGILDDAIREHLELKRKHGADEDELKELEDSAFGPPERPGAENGGRTEIEAEETDLFAEAEEPAPEGDATTVMPSEGEPFDQTAEEPAAPEPAEELTPAERARQEYPQLQDTAAHAPIEAEEPSPVQSTEEQDALEIGLFESDDDDEEDFDVGEIDLELEGDEPVAEESAQEHVVIEPESVVDPDPTDESVVAGSESDLPEQAGGESGEEPRGGGHDMLEETPDFLKEAPESDEMWFEQDEPEDFDFD